MARNATASFTELATAMYNKGMVRDNLQSLRNITPEAEQWLFKIGIENPAEFARLGGKKAYLQIIETGHEPDEELRCRLLGAEQDLDWQIIAKRDSARASSRFADVDEP